ncbi:hypothetical protein Adt_11116 [Abeliophyllum distichum]|uniref:Uncharacterized protein n=1 Tax=Abeliophyllum distichum TaxID=126358 RepID=A0ABD1ULX8_9LAMI
MEQFDVWTARGGGGDGDGESDGGGGDEDRDGWVAKDGDRRTDGMMTKTVPAVFFTRRKKKDEGMVEHTEVVRAYFSSPFTAGVKRSTFVDGSKMDLSQKVSLYKEIEFLKWYSKLGKG